MSDLECEEARRQAYAALRVLERHGERCVLLRRERLEFRQEAAMGARHEDRTILGRCVEEAERYGC